MNEREKQHAAIQMALDVFTRFNFEHKPYEVARDKAIAALREALSQNHSGESDDMVQECRHCGWLCKPNRDESKKWYPLEQNHSEQDLNMVQEPVAWMDNDGNVCDHNDFGCFNIPLYTTPPTAALAAKQMRDALVHISEYWNRDENEMAMADALWHIIETADKAIAALPILGEEK